jgi:proline iminopeptidase
MKRLAGTVALATSVGFIRLRFINWGATAEEAASPLPGDDLVPGAHGRSTMATTLAAPPSEVWPWLVQMGCDRAGFYSWDRLDNGGRASAQRIHPEWQDLEQGGRIISVTSGKAWFDVPVLEPVRALALRATLDLRTGRPFDPAAGNRPRVWSDSVWTFVLQPRDCGTRLIVRAQGDGRPCFLTGLANLLFWQPAHWVMQTRQFSTLKRRTESARPEAAADQRVQHHNRDHHEAVFDLAERECQAGRHQERVHQRAY